MKRFAKPGNLLLAIESSCDETSAAVLRDGTDILSNVVASQLIHADYGGVVPELASREHLRAIVPVVREALQRAGVTYADLDAVAVTEGPGLAGALLVGITFAKSLAFALDKPLIAVNHLEGHIHAVLMQATSPGAPLIDSSIVDGWDADPPRSQPTPGAPLIDSSIVDGWDADPPRSQPTPGAPLIDSSIVDGWDAPRSLLALVVSGGHTHLYLAHRTPRQTWTYRNVGKTLDDAAGEAFDKVAKLLGLPYPGGPWIDVLAPHGDPTAVPFTPTQIKQKATGNTAPKLAREFAAQPTAFSKLGRTRGLQAPDTIGSNAGASAPEQTRRFDLSFSGIKTAVRRYTEVHHMQPAIAARATALRNAGLHTAKPSGDALTAALRHLDTETLNLIASFQAAVTGYLTRTLLHAAEHYGAQSLLVTGGVAANSALRHRLTAAAIERRLPIAFPTIALSTDNAAMIAAAAWPKFLAGDFAPDTLEPTPQLRLG